MLMDNQDKNKTVRLTLRIPDELDCCIREAAQRQGISMNQLILSAINRWTKSRR